MARRAGRPAQKSAGKPSRAPASRRPASSAAALDPRKVGVLAAGVAAAALLAVLMTGGRLHALSAAIARGADLEAARAGFKVSHVKLEGVSPFAQADVLRAAAVHPGDPILGLDLATLRERVETVGWVRSARIVRLLPDTLVISTTERPRLAVWQSGGVSRLVDAEGQVIPEADPAALSDLPLVVGEGANEAAAAVLPLVQARPRLMERLDALVRVDARRWDLRLKDGGIIQLPGGTEDAALIQLDALDQRSRLLELGFARIDLRDADMVTVRPRDAQPQRAPVSAGTTTSTTTAVG